MWLRSALFPLTVFCLSAFTSTVAFHRAWVDSLGWLALGIPTAALALVFAYETWQRLRGR